MTLYKVITELVYSLSDFLLMMVSTIAAEVSNVGRGEEKGPFQDPEVRRISRWYFGGLAATMAASCTHPLDLIKVSDSKCLRLEIGKI